MHMTWSFRSQIKGKSKQNMNFAKVLQPRGEWSNASDKWLWVECTALRGPHEVQKEILYIWQRNSDNLILINIISQLLEYLNKHFQKIEAMPFICNKYASNHMCLVAFLGPRACFLAYLCTWWRLLSGGMNCYDCTLTALWEYHGIR